MFIRLAFAYKKNVVAGSQYHESWAGHPTSPLLSPAGMSSGPSPLTIGNEFELQTKEPASPGKCVSRACHVRVTCVSRVCVCMCMCMCVCVCLLLQCIVKPYPSYFAPSKCHTFLSQFGKLLLCSLQAPVQGEGQDTSGGSGLCLTPLSRHSS